MVSLSRPLRSLFVVFILLLGALFSGRAALARQTTQIGRIEITGSNTDSFPTVQLQISRTGRMCAPTDWPAEHLLVS